MGAIFTLLFFILINIHHIGMIIGAVLLIKEGEWLILFFSVLSYLFGHETVGLLFLIKTPLIPLFQYFEKKRSIIMIKILMFFNLLIISSIMAGVGIAAFMTLNYILEYKSLYTSLLFSWAITTNIFIILATDDVKSGNETSTFPTMAFSGGWLVIMLISFFTEVYTPLIFTVLFLAVLCVEALVFYGLRDELPRI
ncbi:MAG: hypothetical protein L6Q59_16510 [Ignavibacteriaceae bacterium]|nr:hypothetical protein [Ignavibacteriaceae bacterium]